MQKIFCAMLLFCMGLLVAGCTNSQTPAKEKVYHTSEEKAAPSIDSALLKKEKAAIKQASITFLKWMDYKWEGENVKTTPGGWKFINQIIEYKKGSTYSQCPCKVNWVAMDNLAAWMKANAPIISNQYMTDFRQEIKKLEPYLNKTHDDFEAEPPYNAFHFSVGNGGLPELDKTDVYKNTSVWQIDVTTDTTAHVNITFRMPKEWGGDINAYQFKMKKESSNWKAASNLEEGIINPSFKTGK